MKVEVKNVKIMNSLSEETLCFSASVYVDGKRCGSVSNRGNGGCHEWDDNLLKQKIDNYASTLAEEEWRGMKAQPDADYLVDRAMEVYLVDKEVAAIIRLARLIRKARAGEEVGKFKG